MKRTGTISYSLTIGVLLAVLGGCEAQGPAEQAGEHIDKTVEKAGDQIEKAGEALKERTQGDYN